MPDESSDPDTGPGKHGLARQLAERALRAEAEGDQARADELFAEAERTDPSAVADVLQERATIPGRVAGDQGDSDADVARITREVRPGSAAPSRAGVSGPGSGADSERG